MRFYSLCPVPDDLPDKERRRRLRAIGLAVNNAVRDGKERIEFRYSCLNNLMMSFLRNSCHTALWTSALGSREA